MLVKPLSNTKHPRPQDSTALLAPKGISNAGIAVGIQLRAIWWCVHDDSLGNALPTETDSLRHFSSASERSREISPTSPQQLFPDTALEPSTTTTAKRFPAYPCVHQELLSGQVMSSRMSKPYASESWPCGTSTWICSGRNARSNARTTDGSNWVPLLRRISS